METKTTLKNSQKVCPTNKALAELYENGDDTVKNAVLDQLGEGTLQLMCAYGSSLNRYSVRPGKIYGKPSSKERYKILQVSGDLVFFKEIVSGRTDRMDIDDLMKKWSRQGINEITFLDDIIQFIKKHLGPLLGPTLVGGLIGWLMQKLK